MRTRRSVVDYALQRRALLVDLYAGRTGTWDVCDAHPYLLRAAKYHGEFTDTPCPICRKERLALVNYVYGDELKTLNGQAKSSTELPKMAMDFGEFSVYVVEVCQNCNWNYLTMSYVLGRNGLPPRVDEERQAAQD